MNTNEQKKNLITHQYLSSSQTNYVICIGIKKIGGGNYGYAFVAMDLAARNIVGHCYKSEPLNVQNIIDCLDAIIKKISFLPKIRIIHSDRESLLKNEQYTDFLKRKNIEISIGSTKGHENQVIERAFRTLKNYLRKILVENFPIDSTISNKIDPLTHQKGFDIQQIKDAVHKAIEIYNNKPHKSLYLMTPHQMTETLFQHAPNLNNPSPETRQVPILAKNNGDFPPATIIDVYSIGAFLEDFRAENNLQFSQIGRQNKGLYELCIKISGQNKSLHEENIHLKGSLSFLTEEAAVNKSLRLKAEERKQRRKNAKKQALRDSIEPHEFQYMIDRIKAKGFVPSRKRAALILLYCTGLRVSNLLALSVNHIKELVDKGKTHIPLNKGGASRHPIALSNHGKKLLRDHFPDFAQLMLDKEGTQPFFTTQIQLHKPINRCSFDNELNAVLKQVSLELHKHIRTHSFRATIISELLETIPIQIVRDLMGHRSIKTTVQYNRNKVTPQLLENVLASMDKTREEQKQVIKSNERAQFSNTNGK